MLKSELIAQNPLRALDQDPKGGLEPGQLGLIAARAGTGKTAFLVQVALDNLFRGKPVFHVGVGETVSHVKSWYAEVFRDMAAGYNLDKAKEAWEEAEHKRLIMTLQVDAFSIEKVEERFNELLDQNIMKPEVLMVDNLTLTNALPENIQELKTLAQEKNLKIWIALKTSPDEGDISEGLKKIEDFFQLIIFLESGPTAVALNVFKNPAGISGGAPITLDPKTLLLAQGAA